MANIISIADHLAKKKKRQLNKANWNSIWFNKINDGIKELAYKDKDRIFKSINSNYYIEYIKAMANYTPQDNISINNYIKEYLNITKPFSIDHGVEFSSDHLNSYISPSDCVNIADIIVRVSLCYSLDLYCQDMEPINLAQQYNWENVLIEGNLES